MAGWGDDATEIKTGTPVSLTLADDGKVKRINLSGKKLDQTALPMQVTQFDFEDKLFIKGLVLEEEKIFAVDHDATVVERRNRSALLLWMYSIKMLLSGASSSPTLQVL